MKRAKLLPIVGQTVEFSGFFKGRDRRNIMLLRQVRVNGAEFKHAWIRGDRHAEMQLPRNALISGYGTVVKYSREDGSEDISLADVCIEGVSV